MIIQEQKSKVRQTILQLVRMGVPETDTGYKDEIQTLVQEHKFNAIDISCSVLQGWTDMDIQSVVEKNEQEITAREKQLADLPAARKMAMDFERKINELLQTSEKLNQMYGSGELEKETQLTPSLKHLNETIYVANGQLEAESIRFFLNAFGIPARIAQESAGVVLGLTVGSLGEADIRVAPEDAADALDLLQAMQEGLFVFPAGPGEEEEEEQNF
jgi:hypothetical protein